MEYQIIIPENANYVLVKVFTPMTRDLAVKIAAEADEVGKAADIKNLLFDMRESCNHLGVIAARKVIDTDLPEIKDAYFTNISVLVRPDDTSNSFVIVALANKGFNICEFEREEEALAWISKDKFYTDADGT